MGYILGRERYIKITEAKEHRVSYDPLALLCGNQIMNAFNGVINVQIER